MTTTTDEPGTILLIGASRGLGLAMADELAARGWTVIGTVRGDARTGLHDLAETDPGRIAIETLDITRPEAIAALGERLAGRHVDMLFVNAGTTNDDPDDTLATVATEEFVRVMVTNALAPVRVVEGLAGCVRPGGLIGVMSSGQGSIANNEAGGREVYRTSKAALNMAMRSYAARTAGDARPLLLLAPGWIRTDLGGPQAPYGIAESIPRLVDLMLAQRGTPGLRYLDRDGRTVPW